MDMGQFFKNILPFSWMNYQFYSKKSFAIILRKNGRNLHYLNTKNAILMTTSSVFITSDNVITIWYSHLHVSISELNESESALNQRCLAPFSAENSMCQSWEKQFATALNRRKSELIRFETELISTNVCHILWISAEKRQNFETALFRVDYPWDFSLGLRFTEQQWRNRWVEFWIVAMRYRLVYFNFRKKIIQGNWLREK